MAPTMEAFASPLLDRDGNPTDRAGAKVILDSISPTGHRVTTFEARIWRPLLAEFNTHRAASRNSASSRAIPAAIQLGKVGENPAWPTYWGSEQKGMQPGPELEGVELQQARLMLERIRRFTIREIQNYLEDTKDADLRLHKSILNRYIEVWQWQTMIVTMSDSDGWWGFLEQRCSDYSTSAQPEFRDCSDAMLKVWLDSTPQELKRGEWHMPYIDHDTMEWCRATAAMEHGSRGAAGVGWAADVAPSSGKLARRISIARCARVSLLTHDKVRDPNEDLRMFFNTLWSPSPRHWSPFEHVCTPFGSHTHNRGNLPGYAQARHNPDMAVGLR